MWWSHWSWYGWLLMSVGMVAFWAVVAYLVIGLARPGGSESPVPDTPEAILARRLARGEIDDEEYRRRLAALHDRAVPEEVAGR